MTRRFGERLPEPRVIARREVPLPLGRVLVITAIENSVAHVDVWLRIRSPAGDVVGQMHCAPIALRDVADTLAGLAAELGVAP